MSKSFEALWAELSRKAATGEEGSSTVSALSSGTHFIAKKIVEEASEVMLAAESQGRTELADEIAQLIYWVQVLMLDKGISLDEIYDRM